MSCAPSGSPLPGEGEGEGLCSATRRSSSKPLTLVLSPSPRERRSANLQATNSTLCPAHSFVLKRKDYLPIILHADDHPAVLLRLVVERLRERADFRVRQPFSGTVRILSLCIVVQHKHREPRAVSSFGVLEHLSVTGRVAEGSERPAANHQMDALRLARVVIVQKQFRFLGQERLA